MRIIALVLAAISFLCMLGCSRKAIVQIKSSGNSKDLDESMLKEIERTNRVDYNSTPEALKNLRPEMVKKIVFMFFDTGVSDDRLYATISNPLQVKRFIHALQESKPIPGATRPTERKSVSTSIDVYDKRGKILYTDSLGEWWTVEYYGKDLVNTVRGIRKHAKKEDD